MLHNLPIYKQTERQTVRKDRLTDEHTDRQTSRPHCTPAGTKKAWVALKKWRWQQNTPIFLHWKMYPELDFDVLSGIEFLGSWAWSVPVLTAESYLRRNCFHAVMLVPYLKKQTNNIVLNTQAGCHASVWQKLLRPKEGDFVTRRQGMRSNGECTFQHSWSFLLFLTGAMTPSKWLISNTPVLKSKLPAG